MTRWNLLSDILSHPESREAIGKAWPLFFLVIFNMKKENRFPTTYLELQEKLGASPNTIKDWRNHLVEHDVARVLKGNGCMSFVLQSPYDSLVTCEQNDEAQIKMVGDPGMKRFLDKVSGNNNASIFLVMSEMMTRLDNLERKNV